MRKILIPLFFIFSSNLYASNNLEQYRAVEKTEGEGTGGGGKRMRDTREKGGQGEEGVKGQRNF